MMKTKNRVFDLKGYSNLNSEPFGPCGQRGALQKSYTEISIAFQSQQITPQLALKALLEFDKAINHGLATKVKNRIIFKVRYCETSSACNALKAVCLLDELN